MSVNLGSAHGIITIESDVDKGVSDAKSSLMSLGGTTASVAAGMAAAIDISAAITSGLSPAGAQALVTSPPVVNVSTASPVNLGTVNLPGVADTDDFLEQIARLQTA